jgi:hypothetical protein
MTKIPLLILDVAVGAIHIIRVVLFLLRMTPSKVTGFLYYIDIVLLLDIIQI